jgi:polar amino acid transport system substrate-binding protein
LKIESGKLKVRDWDQSQGRNTKSKCADGLISFDFHLSAFCFVGRKLKKTVLTALVLLAVLLMTGCRESQPNQVNTPDDVAGRIIGALSGTPSERLASELGDARIYVSSDEMMAHLKSGVIDCAVMENSAALELVEASSGIRILNEPLIEYDLHFAVAKENTLLLDAVNSSLEKLRQNGTLNGLVGKYFARKRYVYVPPVGIEKHPGSLLLAVPPDSPPFSYVNADGEFSGFDIEVALSLCDVLGVELQIIEYDAWELVNAVWFGMADLSLGWLPGEGEDLVAVSDAYANAVHVVVVRR